VLNNNNNNNNNKNNNNNNRPSSNAHLSRRQKRCQNSAGRRTAHDIEHLVNLAIVAHVNINNTQNKQNKTQQTNKQTNKQNQTNKQTKQTNKQTNLQASSELQLLQHSNCGEATCTAAIHRQNTQTFEQTLNNQQQQQ
jgi:hypothetical protein